MRREALNPQLRASIPVVKAVKLGFRARRPIGPAKKVHIIGRAEFNLGREYQPWA